MLVEQAALLVALQTTVPAALVTALSTTVLTGLKTTLQITVQTLSTSLRCLSCNFRVSLDSKVCSPETERRSRLANRRSVRFCRFGTKNCIASSSPGFRHS